MPFDPSQPYELLPDATEPPPFDPAQPFQLLDQVAVPEFDPSKPYELVEPPSLLQRIKAKLAPGLEAMGRALEADPEANTIAGQAIRDAAAKAGDFYQQAMANARRGAQSLPGPVPGAGVGNIAALSNPMKPMMELPRVPQQTDAPASKQVAAGAANVGIGLAESMTMPVAIASLGAGSLLSAGAQRLLAGAFGIDMASHLSEAAASAGQALESGTLQQKVEAVGGLAATAAMAGLSAKHALTPARITAARGLASELGRAELPGDAVTQGGAAPEPKVGDPKPGVSAAEALEASDAVFEVAPSVDVAAEPSKPATAADVAQRVAEVRATAEAEGADAALQAIRDASPSERTATAIALAASDDVAMAVRRGEIDPDLAESVSRAAPGDAAAQAVGMAAFGDGATVQEAARATKTFRERYPGADPLDVIADRDALAALRSEPDVAGLPSGTTPVTGQRMPVAVNRVVPGSQDIPGIFAQMERVMRAAGTETPIRVGRMGQLKRWARGFYRPYQEVIRLNSASNIPTAAHEVAHALAKEFWSRGAGTANASGVLRGTVPKPVLHELRRLGVNLYGSRRPAAGYVEEGWSEFVRSYLTTDDLPTLAPQALDWFQRSVLPKFPEVAKELKVARDMIDVWRGQGARGRALAMMKPGQGKIASTVAKVRKVLSTRAQVEQLEPLAKASEFWQRRTGRTLRPSEDPYLVATRARGIAPSILTRFVDSGPVDLWGNKTGAPALADVLAPLMRQFPWAQRAAHAIVPKLVKPIQARLEDFKLYLWARRTIERAGKNMETGLSLDDARELFKNYDTPEFQLAAAGYYKWWDSVLDYYAQAGPANAELVRAIRAGSSDYVPLPRVFESVGGRSQSGAGGGLQRMHGSGKPINDVLESTIRVAGTIIEKAHRDLVSNTVIDLSQKEGMGWLVERVPVDKVRQQVSIGKIRGDLEAMGIDTSAVPDSALVEYYAEAKTPSGVDAVYARKGPGGKTEWYVLKPEVYEVLAGVDNPRVAAGMTAGLIAATTRLFKAGTVGLRPAFQIITNSLRDFQNFMIQSSANPARSFFAYFAGVADMLKASMEPVSGGRVRASEYWELLHNLGVPMANSLAHDISQTRAAIRGAVHGRGMRIIAEPVNTFREVISGFESVPREAELRARAAELGWKPGMKLTPDQAVALTVAAKRVTTDFTAGGFASRQANLYIPFYNVSIQGLRTAGRMVRAAVDKPYAERNLIDQRIALGRVAVGGTFLAGLTLANWLRNRDESWYRALPWRERFLYTHVMGSDGIPVKIPRPVEWGNLFMVLPEAIVDSWYRQDPETAVAAAEHLVDTMNPAGLPVPIKAALEQAANRDFFWDRRIVPRSQVDLPPGDQRSEYSSWLAKALGDAFPGVVSPRRVDAAIRQFAGGAASDLVEAVGLRGKIHDRGWEPSDIPIAGVLFRRGGAFTAANRHIEEFYDTYSLLAARSKSKISPLNPNEEAFWKVMRNQKEELEFARQIAFRAKDLQSRQRLWRSIGTQAEAVNKAWRRLKSQTPPAAYR